MRKLRLIMWKYGFSVAIMLAELTLVFAAFFYFGRMFPYVWLGLILLITLATIISIFNRSMAPDSKVTWLLVAMVPVLGPLLYIMFGERRLSKKEIQQLETIGRYDFFVPSSQSELEEIREENQSVAGIMQALLKIDPSSAIYKGTQSEYFALGETYFQSLLQDLEAAQNFIFLEFYIVEQGLMWDQMLEILKRKASQGVEVKFLYDDIGCMATLPGNYARQLREAGIEAYQFNKVVPRMTVAYNNRDHRKILVIDGKIAYTGGVNLADEYINQRLRFGHWKDGGVRLEGEAVQALSRLFLTNWYINRGELEDIDRYHFLEEKKEGQGYYIPYGSGPKPMYRDQVGKKVYQNLITQAQDYIYITTPYLIMDYDLTEDIKNAALRGVDVRIVTPYIPDKKVIQLVTRGAYPDLRSAGVRIFEYEPGFVHSKNVLVDDHLGVVGTINFDYRSLVHHYENAVLMYKTNTLDDMRQDFQTIFDQSIEVTDQTFKPVWYQRLIKEVVQIFAPLL